MTLYEGFTPKVNEDEFLVDAYDDVKEINDDLDCNDIALEEA